MAWHWFAKAQQAQHSRGVVPRLHDTSVYSHMSQEALLQIVLARDNQIRDLRAHLKRSRQQATRSNSALVAARALTSGSSDDVLAIERLGTRKLSPKGALALAIRRNLTNTAANDMSITLMQDVSHQTTAKSEIEAGACLPAAFRAVHR